MVDLVAKQQKGILEDNKDNKYPLNPACCLLNQIIDGSPGTRVKRQIPN